MLPWILLACGTPDRAPSHTPATVGDVALNIEPGARVRAEGRTIQVDVPDGRRWFDLTWAEGDPRQLAEVWAARSCEPVFWDEAVVGESFWARGGLCTLEDRWHWALVLARPVRAEDGSVRETSLVTYVADQAFVPYEDAWVDFVSTALTVGEGQPVATLPEPEVRRRVRAGIARGLGRLPVPGGGVMSTRVHEEMRDLYARLPAPPHAPVAAPPSP